MVIKKIKVMERWVAPHQTLFSKRSHEKLGKYLGLLTHKDYELLLHTIVFVIAQ